MSSTLVYKPHPAKSVSLGIPPLPGRLSFKPWCPRFLHFSLGPGRAVAVLLTKAEAAQDSRQCQKTSPSIALGK